MTREGARSLPHFLMSRDKFGLESFLQFFGQHGSFQCLSTKTNRKLSPGDSTRKAFPGPHPLLRQKIVAQYVFCNVYNQG